MQTTFPGLGSAVILAIAEGFIVRSEWQEWQSWRS